MTLPPCFSQSGRPKPGLTLIELSVLVTVLLFIVGMAFIGVKAWKAGSDRAGCILNIYHAQEAVRAFSNLHGYNPGQTLASVDVEANVFGLNSLVGARPVCPADGGLRHSMARARRAP